MSEESVIEKESVLCLFSIRFTMFGYMFFVGVGKVVKETANG